MSRIAPAVSNVDDFAQAGVVDAARRCAVMLEHPTLAVAVAERGRFRESNAAWRQLFAVPTDVSVETEAAALFAGAAGAERFERAVAGEGVQAVAIASEQTLVRRDGTSFAAEIVVWLFDVIDAARILTADAVWQVRDVTEERALKRELRDLEAYHGELEATRLEVTFLIDRKGRLTYVSPAVRALLGHAPEKLVGEPFMALVSEEDAAGVGQWLRSVPRGRKVTDVQLHRLRVVDRKGESRTLVCRARNAFDVPSIAGMIIHAIDESLPVDHAAHVARAEHARSLRRTLVELAAAAPESLDALLDVLRARVRADVASFAPCDGSTPSVAPAGMPGVPLHGDAADPQVIVVDDASADTVTDGMRQALTAATLKAGIVAPVFADGTLLGWLGVGMSEARTWDDVEADFVVGAAPLATALATALTKPLVVDEPVAKAEPVEEPRDLLTGLPGRGAARAWLERRAATLSAQGTLTMLSIDLDRLQTINDRYGQAAGDGVIARAGRVMTEVIGSGGLVARVGGDAFTVVLANAAPKAVDDTVTAMLARIASTEDDLPRVEASIGIAQFPKDAPDVTALWLYADLAMREAKNRGRGQAFLFDPKLSAAVNVRKALDIEIAEAIERDEFVLFYQPQVALATGKVMGLEALLRWQHPTRGLVMPDVFIDAAVESGLIEAITKSVVNKVCEQIASWRGDSAFPELPVGVNVSGTQFHDRRLPALFASALMRSGLPARLLVLELSEQMMVVDAVETERVVKELSNLGVRTAVGGFALGHGALKQLRQLRVAQIKLDRGFVDVLPADEPSTAVVRTMIDVARKLKVQVIAEGVETREQFEALRSLGCEAGQGFFFGPPLSADEIVTFVAHHRQHPFI